MSICRKFPIYHKKTQLIFLINLSEKFGVKIDTNNVEMCDHLEQYSQQLLKQTKSYLRKIIRQNFVDGTVRQSQDAGFGVEFNVVENSSIPKGIKTEIIDSVEIVSKY